MKSIFLIAVTLLSAQIVACSTSQKHIVLDEGYSRENLFPHGVYHHNVSLTVLAMEPAKSFHFDGLVKISDEQLQINALSPIGTTLFKISENLKTSEIKTEIYVQQMKPYEPKILAYYQVLKSLLLMKSDPKKDLNLRWEKESSLGLPEIAVLKNEPFAKFHFSEYDERKIPKIIQVSGKAFDVAITVTGYEI